MLKDRPAEPVRAAMLLASQQLREVPHWYGRMPLVKWITNLCVGLPTSVQTRKFLDLAGMLKCENADMQICMQAKKQ